MMSCKIPGNATIFHFSFLGESKPERSAALKSTLEAIGSKKIKAMNKHRIVKTFSIHVGSAPQSIESVSTERSATSGVNIPDQAAIAATTLKHCPAYAYDRFRSYSSLSTGSLDHIAADLHIIEKYFSRQ